MGDTASVSVREGIVDADGHSRLASGCVRMSHPAMASEQMIAWEPKGAAALR